MVVGGRVTSYDDLIERVNRWRGGLLSSGLSAGDRVVVLAGNNETFVVAYLAVLTAGMVAVPLNPQVPPPELRRELDALDARGVIVGPAGVAVWTELGGATAVGVDVEFLVSSAVVPGRKSSTS
jgi:acyl-CoA synthetase (AMP-forming)/AMP-acid ligase II